MATGEGHPVSPGKVVLLGLSLAVFFGLCTYSTLGLVHPGPRGEVRQELSAVMNCSGTNFTRVATAKPFLLN